MDLDEFVSRFLEAGVFAEVIFPEVVLLGVEPDSPVSALLAEQTFRDGVFGKTSGLEAGTKSLTEQTIVRSIGTQWSFENIVFYADVNALAVQCYRPLLDDTFSLAWDYYFREPVSIGQWSLPLYQQPSWTLELARSCVVNAAHQTASQMYDTLMASVKARATRASRWRHLDGYLPEFYELLPSWDNLLYCRIAARNSEGEPYLYLRSDLQQAFVVDMTSRQLESLTTSHVTRF